MLLQHGNYSIRTGLEAPYINFSAAFTCRIVPEVFQCSDGCNCCTVSDVATVIQYMEVDSY